MKQASKKLAPPTPSPGLDAFFRRRDDAKRRTARTSLATASGPYPGDFTGLPDLTYDPHPNRLPDPGEVVWAWVPFEDDVTHGKDRPVLIIGRESVKPVAWLLGLPLSSVDHDDARPDAKQHWESIGRGVWDAKARESFVHLDRIIRVDPRRVRRIGGQVAEDIFWAVANCLRRYRGR